MTHSFAISNLVNASRYIRFAILAICLTAFTAGCSRSPRVNFYTLQPAAEVNTTATAATGPVVVIGPVTLPEMLDRPQLVVRVAANRVNILETHRWAEPLKSEITRTITENLRRLLGTDRVLSYPKNTVADAKYRVLVDIQRFESSPDGWATVEATWALRPVAGGAAKNGHSLVREPVGVGDYDSIVAAYDRALLAVSRDLTKAIINKTTSGN